ncbi:hypothetical protein V6N11_065799 [Hibiscus sabdariffa]|uniref:RNase H type-1 domain-containing protein n=1 Tax=Hibiscus sabdariffa TaxID=183260 RepID=A0ABR2PIS5_9ROSI
MPESLDHVLRHYNGALRTWQQVILPASFVEFLSMPLDEWMCYCINSFGAQLNGSGNLLSAHVTWQKPLVGWVKANCDGARRSSDGLAAAGVLSGMHKVNGWLALHGVLVDAQFCGLS